MIATMTHSMLLHCCGYNDLILKLQMVKKWANPGNFSYIFGLFNQTMQFLQQINVKKCQAIQYMAPGFEPTTSQTRLVSHNH